MLPAVWAPLGTNPYGGPACPHVLCWDPTVPSPTSPGGAQRRQGAGMDKGPWHCQGPGPTPTGRVAQSRVRQPPRQAPGKGSHPDANAPHPSAAPWLAGKGQFPVGSRICSCLRLDADGFSISGDNAAAVPAPRVWVRAECGMGWELLSPSPQ